MPGCERQSSCAASTVAALMLGTMVGAWPVAGIAWGEEGHQIVGFIADHYLEPKVRSRVADILAGDTTGLTSTDLVDETVWADRYRDSDRDTTRSRYLQTREWHFVDIEVAAPDLDAACFGRLRLTHGRASPDQTASAGPAADCIVEKIEQFRNELHAAGTLPAERRLALQFLLHLMGDMHQPLHVADRHDRGGNELHVTSRTHPAGTLHHYWDSVFVADLGSEAALVAAQLLAELPEAQRRAYAEGSITQWVWETFNVAKNRVYGPLPSPGGPSGRGPSAGGPRPDGDVIILDQSYSNAGEEIVAVQLQRAGVRLAQVLNEALR